MRWRLRRSLAWGFYLRTLALGLAKALGATDAEVDQKPYLDLSKLEMGLSTP